MSDSYWPQSRRGIFLCNKDLGTAFRFLLSSEGAASSEDGACNTISYNSSAKKARIHQKVKMHIYMYSIVFLNTYPGLFRRIDCTEEWRQYQRLVEIIEYFTTSLITSE